MSQNHPGPGQGSAFSPDLSSIREFFKGDRFARHSAIELVDLAPGYARAKMDLQSFHHNGVGIVHGGAIFTLADFAFAVASNSHATLAVAINATISIVKATTEGVLWAEAREVSRSYRLGTYSVEVKNEVGELIALFQGTVYRKGDPLPL